MIVAYGGCYVSWGEEVQRLNTERERERERGQKPSSRD